MDNLTEESALELTNNSVYNWRNNTEKSSLQYLNRIFYNWHYTVLGIKSIEFIDKESEEGILQEELTVILNDNFIKFHYTFLCKIPKYRKLIQKKIKTFFKIEYDLADEDLDGCFDNAFEVYLNNARKKPEKTPLSFESTARLFHTFFLPFSIKEIVKDFFKKIFRTVTIPENEIDKQSSSDYVEKPSDRIASLMDTFGYLKEINVTTNENFTDWFKIFNNDSNSLDQIEVKISSSNFNIQQKIYNQIFIKKG
jgi:hypothetical protein